MGNIQLDHSQHAPTGKTYPICLLAHDIDVPMNVGSLFRMADALGVEKIFLSGSSSVPPNPKITKTSRSTEKYVPFAYGKDPFEILESLKADGYSILSLELTTSSIDIGALPMEGIGKVCLVLGSENAGVSQGLLDASDHTVHIPMLGRNSSMNVAMACAIAVYELTRRMRL